MDSRRKVTVFIVMNIGALLLFGTIFLTWHPAPGKVSPASPYGGMELEIPGHTKFSLGQGSVFAEPPEGMRLITGKNAIAKVLDLDSASQGNYLFVIVDDSAGIAVSCDSLPVELNTTIEDVSRMVEADSSMTVVSKSEFREELIVMQHSLRSPPGPIRYTYTQFKTCGPCIARLRGRWSGTNMLPLAVSKAVAGIIVYPYARPRF